MDPVNIPAKFEVRSFKRSWDNRGYSKKFGQSLDTPTLPFLQNFSRACVRMDPVNVSAKFAVRIALAVPEIIVIAVSGWGCEPPILGKGIVPFERALVTSYRLSIVTFLYLYAFQIYCSFCSPARHPTPNLPQISPCSSGIRWMAFGLRRTMVLV